MPLTPKTATISWTAVAGSTSYELVVDGKTVSTAGAKATEAVFTIGAGTHTIEVVAKPSGQVQGLTSTVAVGAAPVEGSG
jgi:hypothetical protein